MDNNTKKRRCRAEDISDGVRIAKYLSHAGICSRRDGEKLVAAGRVYINGAKVEHPSARVYSGDIVKLDDKIVEDSFAGDTLLFAYYKPVGLVTTHRDELGRKTVFDAVSEVLPDAPRLVSVGRLDINSEGLLLLTNDGKLAGELAHPKSGLKRNYRVRVYGRPTEKQLNVLCNGVTIGGVKYGKAEIISYDDRRNSSNSWLTVSIREGKNREIRKMFAYIGCPVNRLLRTDYGPFSLGDMRAGEIRKLSNWRKLLHRC